MSQDLEVNDIWLLRNILELNLRPFLQYDSPGGIRDRGNIWIGILNYINDYGVVISLDLSFDRKIGEMCKLCQSLNQDDSPIALIMIWRCVKTKTKLYSDFGDVLGFDLLIDWIRYGSFVKVIKMNGEAISRAFEVASLCANAFERFEYMATYHLSDAKLLECTSPFFSWKKMEFPLRKI
jgi:hypothetical protein